MALVLADRVKETTTTAGTGAVTLAGASAGFQTFSSTVGNGNTTYYVIAGQGTSEWEVGIGTYTSAGNTLARTTVLSSSNAGALVTFSSGTKDVWVDYAAGKAVTTDTLAYPPEIGGTTPAAGTFTTLTATGQTSLGGAAGANNFRVLGTTGTINYWQAVGGDGATTNPRLSVEGTSGNTSAQIASKGTGVIQFITGGTSNLEQMRVGHTASAVNYVQVTGAATGGTPIAISAQGSDASVNMTVRSKGNGYVGFTSGGGSGILLGLPNGSANYFTAGSSNTGNGVQFAAAGSDTNISQVFQSKGTGAIDLAAGSSGVNISNGGTVTATTRTALGTYTTAPSVVISAPTTAGGVQATGVAIIQTTAATIAGGGTGYTVGDTITMVGGTLQTGGAGTFRVASVSGGVITSVDTPNYSQYLTPPTNPVSVTGGTGSGATLTVSYIFGYVSLTNAGSGYVEQPTITFSGGGGSGASAAATIGSGTVVRSLGSTMSFVLPSGGTTFKLSDNNISNDYYAIRGSPAGYPEFYAEGSSGGVAIQFMTKGTAPFRFFTRGTSYLEQFRINDSASAVNFVQVAGGATGGAPYVATNGSDTNIDLNLSTKGIGVLKFQNAYGTQLSVGSSSTTPPTAFANISSDQYGRAVYGSSGATIVTASGTNAIAFQTASTGSQQVVVTHTGSAVNYLQLTGAVTGGAPSILAQGSDTNISLSMASKGTGILYLGGGQTRIASNGSNTLYLSGQSGAVNYTQITSSTTGYSPAFIARGSDTNVGLLFGAQNDANIDFQASGDPNAGTGKLQLRIAPTVSAVNYVQLTGSATGSGVTLSAQGSDTNIPLVLQPKGTGALQAQQTDSTATGGNARGANAVDWQTNRGNANQVASAQFSTVSGGSSNRVSSYGGFVGGGESNLVSSYDSVAVAGASNQATAGYSFVGGGLNNFATGSNSVSVGGYFNTASGFNGFVGGGERNSTTSSAAVTTQATTTVTSGSTAVTLSGSNAAIKVGQLINGTGITGYPNLTYVAAISGTSLTLSQVASGSGSPTLSFFTPHGVVVGGGNNQATGSYSFIGGGGDAGTAAQRNTASGDWSFVGGGKNNVASGLGAVIAGGGTFTGGQNGNTASGAASAIGGGAVNNNSSFLGVICGGYSNQATGTGSVVTGGFSNLSSNSFGTVNGGTNGVTRAIVGNSIFPSCDSPITTTQGATQAGLVILARETTNATATLLASNASAAGTTNQVIMPNNSAYYFKGSVIANVTGAANGAAWSIEGAIMRGANAASTVLIGTPTVNRVGATAGASAWSVALTADTTNGGLAVTVTGAAGTTIRWVCKAETTEVTY